jgi:hypothetical protein
LLPHLGRRGGKEIAKGHTDGLVARFQPRRQARGDGVFRHRPHLGADSGKEIALLKA